MVVSLTLVRYPKATVFFALWAMVLHRFPLWFNRRISFFKLMGCGKNGFFDIRPDWRQWAILTVHEAEELPPLPYGSFIHGWYRFFRCETFTIQLSPLESHGLWAGKTPFGKGVPNKSWQGPVAVLTRASIRPARLRAFWRNVAPAASQLGNAEGFLFSAGIGELPWIRQATFSIWSNMEDMKNFAYRNRSHAEVIGKTRKENWYSEELFARFRVISVYGSLKGVEPLKGKL